ncbi:MAG: response regulator [Sphingobacteriales bacterium]|nr:MAG: response regulator [Sphingobacteriales bacterium]
MIRDKLPEFINLPKQQALTMEQALPGTTNTNFNGARFFTHWFDTFVYIDGKRYLNRFKFALVTIFIVFFVTVFTNYFSAQKYSFIITLSGSLACIILGYLDAQKKHKLARILFSFLLNAAAFTLCFVEGISSGAFFFYFLIVVIANFISEKENYGELRAIYTLTFVMLVITFFICPQKSELQVINQEMEQLNLLLNAIISFIIGGMLSYHMMKDSFHKEKALVSKERFLDSVYNTSLDAILIVSDKGIITDCNTESLNLFGYPSKNKLLGKYIYNLFEELDADDESLLHQQLQETNTWWQGELTCKTIDSKNFTGFVSVIPMTHETKQLKKINILDITATKQARADLEKAKEKAENAVLARTKFVSNMSHELRTPLNGIIGSTNLLLQNNWLPDQKQYFDILKYSSEHMLGLINDILDFSKIEAGKMELEKTGFSLNSLMNKLHTLFAGQFEKKGLTLTVNADEQLKELSFYGDPTRLNQVLTNLISNALKFTTSGGVSLIVKQITRNSNACSLKFMVKDTGIGIPKEKQHHIFESFAQADTATTRKFGGTGLGLSISAKIIELHGGQLQVESVHGEGSTFFFTIQLDFDYKRTSYLNEEVVRELRSLKGMKVLVAEDNPINMLIAKAVLEKWGIEVTEAVNGKEALDMYLSGEKVFDLVLADLEMPIMDGYELLHSLRTYTKDLPIITFTAALFENMQAHLINKGFTDYIQKPFRPEDLHRKLAVFYTSAE